MPSGASSVWFAGNTPLAAHLADALAARGVDTRVLVRSQDRLGKGGAVRHVGALHAVDLGLPRAEWRQFSDHCGALVIAASPGDASADIAAAGSELAYQARSWKRPKRILLVSSVYALDGWHGDVAERDRPPVELEHPVGRPAAAWEAQVRRLSGAVIRVGAVAGTQRWTFPLVAALLSGRIPAPQDPTGAVVCTFLWDVEEAVYRAVRCADLPDTVHLISRSPHPSAQVAATTAAAMYRLLPPSFDVRRAAVAFLRHASFASDAHFWHTRLRVVCHAAWSHRWMQQRRWPVPSPFDSGVSRLVETAAEDVGGFA